jgi:predicted TIM-barrel fold metal-dependent hydrolase
LPLAISFRLDELLLSASEVSVTCSFIGTEMATEIVDSHHHLWSLSGDNGHTYKWLGPVEQGGAAAHFAGDINQLKQNYLLDDYLRDANNASCRVVKSVHVQAEADDPLDFLMPLSRMRTWLHQNYHNYWKAMFVIIRA